MKKLSIITINYNNRDGLRKTIESVVAQTTRDFEYIVIDGGSTDGSVDVIKEYSSYIDYWVSEPDKGIYNAMNKGVRAASGQYCQFLNSGDWLYNETVIANFIGNNSQAEIISGKTMILDGDKKTIAKEIKVPISFLQLYKSSINHQSTFIRTQLLKDIPYDENFRICSDWKFWIDALIINNCSFEILDFFVSVFNLEGISNKQLALNHKEREAILKSYGFPLRIIADYDKLDFDTLELAEKLHKYQGFRNKVCRIANICIWAYEALKK